jgi:hypothetical protein
MIYKIAIPINTNTKVNIGSVGVDWTVVMLAVVLLIAVVLLTISTLCEITGVE